MKHANVVKTIQLALGNEPDLMMWTNPTSFGWTGVVQARIGSRVILDPASGENFGLCEGSSDLILCIRRLITPEMVGRHIGQFGAIEAKTEASETLRPKQVIFLNNVREMGGVAGVAKTGRDAHAIVRGEGSNGY